VTCTPYGINTHRLLVRGHRIKNSDGDAQIISDAVQIKPIYIAPFIAVPIFILLVAYILTVTSHRYQEKHLDQAQKYLTEKGLKVSPQTQIKTYQDILLIMKKYMKNHYHK